ncbi:MAG: hypothetical protein KGI37_05065 [Alphaproteobacteria bacterium]|nr:hypothetical protein [Alphaproteobacteria bacterium]
MFAILTGWLSSNAMRLIGWGAIAASVTAILLGARQEGRNAERYDQLQKAMEIKNAQLQATLTAPRTRDELVGSLRDGKF